MEGLTDTALARFMAKVEVQDNGCWRWTAAITKHGYGQLRVGRVMQLAHRVSHVLFVGPIPAGLEVDHLCRHRHCVNPDHLEAVTKTVNLRRAIPFVDFGIHYRSKTHCPHGHPYDDENTYGAPGNRKCRTCVLARMRDYYKRKKAA